MKPEPIIFSLVIFDVALILAMVFLFTGCLSITLNINVAGKQEPINTVDTPYRSVLPWIDAGGDVMAEGDAAIEGAEVVVPLAPPEGAFGPIEDIEVPE